MRKVIPLLLSILIILICLAVPSAGGNDTATQNTVAVQVDGGQIRAGDRIILVSGYSENAVSLKLSDKYVDSFKADIQTRGKDKLINTIPRDTAIFTVEDAGNGNIYLVCGSGYLTSVSAGNGLYYSQKPESCSAWRIENGGFLYNPNVKGSGSGGSAGNNYYLEFYSGYVTTYGKNGNTNASRFVFMFFRLEENGHAAGSTYYLPVFETSDTHGYIAGTSGDDDLYLLAYISDKVKDVRGYGAGYRKDKALLLDGGDMFQGNPLSNLLQGDSISAAYSIMDYDAVTIGNHEFDWGIGNTIDADKTMKDYSFGSRSGINDIPVVASNIYHNGKKIDFAYDYVIIEKTATDVYGNEASVRIGVIGFAGAYDNTIRNSLFTGAGYRVDLNFAGANALAASLESEKRCDATILLTHEAASEIAEGLGRGSAIDLVLGGHTHVNDCGVTGSNVSYLQPASNGAAYSYCEMTFTVENGRPVFQEIKEAKTVYTDNSRAKNTASNKNELDPEMVALTKEVLDQLESVLDEKVGYITVNASRHDFIPGSGDRSTVCGNWMSSMTARMAGADVGFINAGGIRTDFTLDKKSNSLEITKADVWNMFPFQNSVWCFEITYKDLLHVLEYSLTEAGSTVLSDMSGVDCYYNGKNVSAIVTQDGQTVYRNGKWSAGWGNKKVRVAVSDFIATTDRVTSDGVHNPFCEWLGSDRQTNDEVLDTDGAFEVLTAEAAANNGRLYIDTGAHYLLDSEYRQENGGRSDPVNNDKTADENGDGSALPYWVIVVAVAAALIVFVVVKTRKKSSGKQKNGKR